MKCILDATGMDTGLQAFHDKYSTSMIPLLDRPIIQHIVEYIVSLGVTDIHVILHHLPEKIEAFLDDGSRWGCQFSFSVARDPTTPFDTVRSMILNSNDRILGASVTCIPELKPWIETRENLDDSPCVLFYRKTPETETFTGWFIGCGENIHSIPTGMKVSELETIIEKAENSVKIVVDRILDLNSYETIIDSHKQLLAGDFDGLMFNGREIEPGIWMNRNVTLHRSAKINPPVYLGENCRIGPGNELGPNAVISQNCIIDSKSHIENSVIFPDSFIGEGLDIMDSMVDKNRLVNTRIKSAIEISDQFILGSMAPKIIKKFIQQLISRSMALLIFILLSPIFILLFLWTKLTGKSILRRTVVKLPIPVANGVTKEFERLAFPLGKQPENGIPRYNRIWAHFVAQFIPGLINVICGHLSIVGVPSRTVEEIEAMSPDWKELYLKSKAGLINELTLKFKAETDWFEEYAADTYYSVNMGFRYDLLLIIQYIGRLLRLR